MIMVGIMNLVCKELIRLLKNYEEARSVTHVIRSRYHRLVFSTENIAASVIGSIAYNLMLLISLDFQQMRLSYASLRHNLHLDFLLHAYKVQLKQHLKPPEN